MDAITYFPRPVNRTDKRSFCGLVQQFEAFSPDITELMRPINDLLSTKSVFQWLPAQEDAFKRVIAELQSPRVLAQYRPGAGAHPNYYFAEVSLTTNFPSGILKIWRCSNIEKEIVGIITKMARCYHYTRDRLN